MQILPGFRSLCIIPLLCIYAIAYDIYYIISLIYSSYNYYVSIKFYNDYPSIYSIKKYIFLFDSMVL